MVYGINILESLTLQNMKEDNLEELVTTTLQLWRNLGQKCWTPPENSTLSWLNALALQMIERNAGCTMSELATALNSSLSSTTQLVERLVQAGYLERQPDIHDRRIIRVVLSEKGTEEAALMQKSRRRRLSEVFQAIPKEDIDTLIRIQKILIGVVQASQKSKSDNE